ncbi:helix-turn-helix domain-containing protein [Chromobacterium phragmitis]|uniref:Transcriptional regulator n=1 Tax=Chromobacterium phragmitis TaxID=2202141 RepID=A0A344UPF0_9NEIS|nr:helix-turn-helix transcriptional regulator [Chromobacterium phragmitis]AXE37148.1 transcriptional regulator [Chromobacterium phragmitis]
MSTAFPQNLNVRTMRNNAGQNQSQFWEPIGITQSGGSRYESGRNMPKPVAALVRLVHQLGIDISKVNADKASLIRVLLSDQVDPEILAALRKLAATAEALDKPAAASDTVPPDSHSAAV